ncbi:MAG TPA: TlpA disulfide reductase family protein, partial [Fibrobacteraceae bacterium]|nr:TlpA disulfide reductase family protein [Fibrobacteraceae bacterium]
MNNRRLLWAAAVLTVLMLTLNWITHRQRQVPVMAVNFELPRMNGGGVERLDAYSEKVRLLVFWATWCAPCVSEIPSLVALQQDLGPKGFQILAVTLDENPHAVTALDQKYHFNYPVLSGTDKVVRDYGGVESIPMSFLIDRQNRVSK